MDPAQTPPATPSVPSPSQTQATPNAQGGSVVNGPTPAATTPLAAVQPADTAKTITPSVPQPFKIDDMTIDETQVAAPEAGQPNAPKPPASDQIRRLGEKIEKSEAPEELRELLTERIQRLALLRASAGVGSPTYVLEYETTSTYINWCVGLPWNTMSKDTLDLIKAKEILDKNHYGLDSIKERILEYLATIILNLKNQRKDNVTRSPIICLVGLAGTGKTTLSKSIAEALGRQFVRIPFGGMADSRVLRGQSRAFADAEPGVVIKNLVQAKTKNPVILLDELDRVTESARADIMGVLIELLDPGQNFAFNDHYIDYPFDLSHVLFVATANNTTNISTAVADRLEIIQMPSYTDQEKLVIAQKYLFTHIRDQVGLLPNQLTITDDVWPGIIRPLGFDSGIRSLQRTVEGVCRKAARQIVEGKTQQVVINATNIKEYLPHW